MSNKVEKSWVSIEIETTSGYQSRETFFTGEPSDPLKHALREIARILTINGEGDAAVALVAEAKAAVEQDLKKHD